MSARYHFVGSVVLAVLVAAPALAGWGPDGATIKATTNNIPKIAAVNDGGHGSFVVWQEESSPGSGVVRAQHVLATGDLDPGWASDGLLVCSVLKNRSDVGMVSDGLGGAYAWWKEGASIYLSRFDAGGAIATGWPARGRLIGTTTPASLRPSTIPDGANGIYLGWVASAIGTDDPSSLFLIHLGPGNTGAGGWPNTARAASSGDPVATIEYWPRLALAPDGGVFVAWAAWSLDPGTIPSAYRLRRMTSAGLNASGWPVEGLDLGLFHGEWLDSDPQTGLVGLSDDGLGGVFALIGFLTSNDGSTSTLESKLFRLQGDGATSPGWPAAGLSVDNNGIGWYSDQGPDASLRVLADGVGGAQVGQPLFFDHGTGYEFAATLPDGGWKPYSSASGGPNGYEVASNGAGGVYLADFYPKGPYGPYDPYAYLRITQSLAPSSWANFFEIHYDAVVQWYGDIGLAESGDGGAVFFWSQVRDRYGLFARRFNGAGQVTSVPPGAEVAALSLGRLRFVAGEGVRLSLSLPAGEPASLDLFDVSGRRVAAARIDREGSRELTLPGTAALPSGLYFARLATVKESSGGRVIVTR